MLHRSDGFVTGTLRVVRRTLALSCVAGLAMAQTGPAAIDPTPDKPASAVPAPPIPAQTLPEGKSARPPAGLPASTGSAATTSSGPSAAGAMRSLRTAPTGFITAPAPVLPSPAAPPAGSLQPAAGSPLPATEPAKSAPTEIAIPVAKVEPAANSVPSLELAKPTPAAGPAVPANHAAPLSLAALKRLSREEILATTSDTLSIYVLRDNERALVLDFPNVREQGRVFARLILFIERSGTSKTRVMTVPEVQKWLALNAASIDSLTAGNNMRTGEVARFFNSARFQGEPMTVHEQRLYESLLQLQLLREEDSGVSVVEPERILVSVPQASSVAGCPGCTVSPAARAVILQHELSHAHFATNTVYQDYAIWFWSNSLTLAQRDRFQRFLRTRGYDSTIRELCANEMQAFLMHTPDPQMFSAADVGMTDAELAELRQRFQDGLAAKPRAAADRAYQLE